MAFLAQDIPVDWQETYLREIQRVSPEDVLRVIQAEYDPAKITLLRGGRPGRVTSGAGGLGPGRSAGGRRPDGAADRTYLVPT